MTDIRPIFGDDATEVPAAAVLTHMLKIQYYHNGEPNDFFVVLDNLNLWTLRQVIERAEEKAATLRSLIKATDITYLDPERDTDDC